MTLPTRLTEAADGEFIGPRRMRDLLREAAAEIERARISEGAESACRRSAEQRATAAEQEADALRAALTDVMNVVESCGIESADYLSPQSRRALRNARALSASQKEQTV